MGKCYSFCNRGQRKKSDFYQTHYSLTEQLLENEFFDKYKIIHEPACGEYSITKVLLKKGFNNVISTDILYGIDFLKSELKCDYIITNPPYSLAYEFIEKSKQIAKEKIAMLLPLSYLHGQKRYENKIFTDNDYPLTKIYVFTRYPMLSDKIRNDGKYITGMQVYAWFIWEKLSLEEQNNIGNIPVIKWIDNNKYVLNKGK